MRHGFCFEIANSKAFQPVILPTPTDSEIEAALYKNKKRIKTLDTEFEKKLFVDQWKKLIAYFDNVMSDHGLYLKARCIPEGEITYYDTYRKRLEFGVIDSINNRSDGYFSAQENCVYAEFKVLIECICYQHYLNRASQKNSEVMRAALSELMENLDQCGPGIYTHTHACYLALYQQGAGLFSWLAKLREVILQQCYGNYWLYYSVYYREKNESEISDAYKIHVYNAFLIFGNQQGWNLLSGHTHFRDQVLGVVIPSEIKVQTFGWLNSEFIKAYATESIDFLSDCLQQFLLEKVSQYSWFGRVRSTQKTKFDAFFSEVVPVLETFELSPHDFFLEGETKKSTYFQLKNEIKNSDYVKCLLAVSLKKMGLIHNGPLYLLRVISAASVDHGFDVTTLLEKLIKNTPIAEWWHEFKMAYDASIPGSRTWSLVRSTSSFDALTHALGFRNSMTAEEKFSALVHSEKFALFFWDNLSIGAGVLRIFQQLFPQAVAHNAHSLWAERRTVGRKNTRDADENAEMQFTA